MQRSVPKRARKRARSPLGAVSLVLVSALGCRSRAPQPTDAKSAAPSATSALPRLASASGRPRPQPVGCRVLEATGGDAASPRKGDLLDGSRFVDLSAGTSLKVKHSATLRELTLSGPGRFRPCPNGEEAVLVTSGTVVTVAGPGARAGAEVTLATPFGVAHYGDAALKLDVTDRGLTLAVSHGTVAFGGRADGEPKTKEELGGPSGRLKVEGEVDPRALAERCFAALAAAAPDGGRAAGPADAGRAPLGAWAVERLRARKAARLACARAEAATGRLEGPPQSRLWAELEARIDGADPRGSAPPHAEK